MTREKNLAALEASHPTLANRLEQSPEQSDQSSFVVTRAKDGRPTLSVTMALDKTLAIHSRHAPEREAESLTAGIDPDAEAPVVLLGMGLGYPLISLAEKLPPDRTIVLVEPDMDLFRLALEHLDMAYALKRPGLILLVGLDEDDTIKAVSRLQVEHRFSPICLIPLKSLVKARPDVYQGLEAGLRDMTGDALRKRLTYPRFDRDKLKVLIVNSKYYLIPEVEAGLSTLGHEYRRLMIRDKEFSSEEVVRDLLRVTAEFQPDFMLTINHLGFDREGILTRLIENVGLPFASWYVDSPTLILTHYHHNRSELGAIFLWDSDYIEDVKNIGFDKVHYLPLAADVTRFNPKNGRRNPLRSLACDVSFVGNSMTGPVSRKIRELGVPDDFTPHLERMARAFITHPDKMAGSVIDQKTKAHPYYQSLDQRRVIDLGALITWRATQIYRLERVVKLAEFGATIIGDEKWRDMLGDDRFSTPGPLGYYEQLPWFYPVSKVNFNATSLQMKTGLNQRIFDVPASAAFLITDNKRQLADLYDPGKEVVTYDHPDEIPELVRYYLGHDPERQEVIQRAHRRTMAQHTYAHRIEILVNTMRREFGL